MRYRLVGVVAAIGMILAACGGAAPQSSGPSEGIQVHGDWTIEVYNEDGSLDGRVQFENALHPTGQAGLIEYLNNESTPGKWSLWIVGVTPEGGPLCPDTGDPQSRCVAAAISEALDLDDVHGRETLRLTGETTVDLDGEIRTVTTAQGRCADTTPPSECELTGGFPFTEKTFDPGSSTPPVAVSSGQTVHVQVDISFTSG